MTLGLRSRYDEDRRTDHRPFPGRNLTPKRGQKEPKNRLCPRRRATDPSSVSVGQAGRLKG